MLGCLLAFPSALARVSTDYQVIRSRSMLEGCSLGRRTAPLLRTLQGQAVVQDVPAGDRRVPRLEIHERRPGVVDSGSSR